MWSIEKKINIDEKKLSKKYRTNISSLINAWKKGRSDMEIASLTGIDLFTLKQIKSDIELTHRKQRMEQKKEALGSAQSSSKRQIFLRPLM